jgi:hypothetical protein
MEATTPNTSVCFIGAVSVQITGNQLPSRLQALRVLFFHLRVLNLRLDDAINETLQEVILFWKKAQLPTQDIRRCREKLHALYQQWHSLIKHKNRSEQNENTFMISLLSLFDIAHGNVSELVDERKMQFLVKQRTGTREGYIADIEPEIQSQDLSKYDDEINVLFG